MSGDALTEHIGPVVSGPDLRELADLVGVDGVEIVDIGASPLVGEPPAYAPLVEAGLARVTAFDPDQDALAALQEGADADDGVRMRHFGHAVGDGARHTLRQCSAAGFSSLLEPDVEQLAVLTDFPRLATVESRTQIDTVRLDDVEGIEVADLITLDVQGSEPAVLDGGRRVLSTAVAVQVEVAFHRLYEDGPTLADVDVRLRAAGLVPHMFVTTRTWPLAPVTWDDPLQAYSRHLVEADLLYVIDPARLRDRSDGSLRRAVLLACGAYGSVGLGLVCVDELVARGALDAGAADEYRRIVSTVLGIDGGRP